MMERSVPLRDGLHTEEALSVGDVPAIIELHKVKF
jgi:hypothetical protein